MAPDRTLPPDPLRPLQPPPCPSGCAQRALAPLLTLPAASVFPGFLLPPARTPDLISCMAFVDVCLPCCGPATSSAGAEPVCVGGTEEPRGTKGLVLSAVSGGHFGCLSWHLQGRGWGAVQHPACPGRAWPQEGGQCCGCRALGRVGNRASGQNQDGAPQASRCGPDAEGPAFLDQEPQLWSWFPDVPAYRGGRGRGPSGPCWKKILRHHRCGRDLPRRRPCSSSPSPAGLKNPTPQGSSVGTPPCFKDMLNVFDIGHISQDPQ